MALAIPVASQAQTVLSNEYSEVASLSGATVQMYGKSELHITNGGTPVSGSTINMHDVDSWVFLHAVKPSSAVSLLTQFQVDGAAAENGSNVRVVQHGQGAVVIPYPSGFKPMEVFDGENFSGDSVKLSSNVGYGVVLQSKISSFKLKRGYTATLAQNSDGTGLSVNYVASDGDLEIGALPNGLNNQVSLIRIFPWRWTAKKGACDVTPSDLDAKWYYNWNISGAAANPDYEYVAIKQQPNWPGLDQNWAYMGVNHLSGFNEPNNPVEDAYKNLTPPGDVANAVARQPELLGTGLRLGTPAVTDGGRQWILDFVSGAEAAGYRIDYIPIHYYRAYWNNDDPAGAANALYAFLKDIYDNTHKPIWLTEFNNGADWTDNTYDPTVTQNRNVIEAMINKMDDAPWVERYSIYSHVEWFRQTHYDDGYITPMGQMYKDHESPIGYQQTIPGKGMQATAVYYFENNLNDGSGSGNHAVSKDYPDFVAGHNGGTALQFDGVDDHVILPDSLSDCPDFTFAAWVKWDGGPAWQRIFDFGILDSGNKYMFLTPSDGGSMKFVINRGLGEAALTTTALPTGAWRHVAVTLSGNTGRLYVNGSQVATGTIAPDPDDLGAIQHYLGRSMFPNDPNFDGILDDVIIKKVAMSADQIADLANGNQAPQVIASKVDGGDASIGVPYSGSVAGSISDPDGGTITYDKVYGPAWLSVASNGSLSGTPGVGDAGPQYATIRGSDAAGAMSYTLLEINKPAPPDFEAGPVAYWDFDDVALGAANGSALPDSDGYTVWRKAATDKTGNGNHLTTWDYDFAGFDWSTSSPQGDFSIVAAGSFPAAYTWSDQSAPSGIDAESVVLSNFTVEALVTTTGSGIRTAVGRDARYVAGNASLSAFYLGVGDNDHPRALMVDENGTSVEVVADSITVPNDDSTWYHLAAVKSGDTLALYVNGVEENAVTVPGLGALAKGVQSGSDWHTGGWSLGRGLYAGGHVDRWFGHIDAVSISGVGLTPSAFVLEDMLLLAAPTGLAAESGNHQVYLSWNVISNATSYAVKRSLTSGGPYTVLSSPTTTNFLHSGMPNGLHFYYVVAAVNALGEGPNSEEADAIPSVDITDAEREISEYAIGSGTNLSVIVSNTVVGHRYQVLGTDRLDEPDWQPVSTNELGTGSSIEFNIPIVPVHAGHYYKLDVQRY